MGMSDFESARWRHPSSKARIDVEIEMMETMWCETAPDSSINPTPNIEPPVHKRVKRAGRRKPRNYGMVWRL